jgi:hypothetical protein
MLKHSKKSPLDIEQANLSLDILEYMFRSSSSNHTLSESHLEELEALHNRQIALLNELHESDILELDAHFKQVHDADS